MRTDQLTLGLETTHTSLWPYWRECLRGWVADVRHYRHARNTTGWSCATSDFSFARWLFRDGQLTRAEFRRYWRLNQRVQRWEKGGAPDERA